MQAEKSKLEAERAELAEQVASFVTGAKTRDMEKLLAKVSSERDLLEERLKTLTRENRKLKVDVAVHERTKSEEWSGERRQTAMLREQMNELAAEVVRLTATLEGPGSPIDKALGPSVEADNDAGKKIASLADRVRALQRAAASG